MIRHTSRLLQVKVLASWVALAMWWPLQGLSLDIRGHLSECVCMCAHSLFKMCTLEMLGKLCVIQSYLMTVIIQLSCPHLEHITDTHSVNSVNFF